MTPLLQRLYHLPLVGWVLRHRFPRFAIVGATGTVVNLVVLYFGQEHLFRAIEPEGTRLNFSLPLAVFVATINNFTWNRLWTWHDRREHVRTRLVVQFAQYGAACWLGIVLQFVITKGLADHVHYLVANVVAIVIASIANFLVNDYWTFGRLRLLLHRARHRAHAHDHPAEPPPK